jgi:hypothetical protein
MTKNNGGAVLSHLDFVAKLTSGIAQSRAETRISGGKPFLRLLKGGEWVFGQEDLVVEPGSRWCVNLMSLSHGFCCWVDMGSKNELKGEVMVSMTMPRPPRPEPIDGTPYAEQRGFELKCMGGEDKDTEVIYKTASRGGMGATDELLATIQKRLAIDPEYCYPVVELDLDSYDHKKYGKTYVPIFTVVGWVDGNGEPPKADAKLERPARPEVKAAPEPEAPAKRTRSRKGTTGTETPPPDRTPDPTPAPVSTTQAHTGQRRRPGQPSQR